VALVESMCEPNIKVYMDWTVKTQEGKMRLFEVKVVAPGGVLVMYVIAQNDDEMYHVLGGEGVEFESIVSHDVLTSNPDAIAIFQA